MNTRVHTCVLQVDVVELHVELTPAMRACQAALLDLIDGCVKELKLGNTRVRGQETVEEMKQVTQVF